MIVIVYESKTGHTLKYAEMLSEKLHIPYYPLKEAKDKIKENDKVIFLSWICAGKITNLEKVEPYNIICYGIVGACPYSGKYLKQLKKDNKINKPLFYLRGGIDYSKLNIFKKLIVKIYGQTMKNKDEKTKLMFKKGYSFVSVQNLEELIKFMQIKHI